MVMLRTRVITEALHSLLSEVGNCLARNHKVIRLESERAVHEGQVDLERKVVVLITFLL